MREELEALGFRVIAFSPDRPEKMVKSLEVEDLGYELYSDSDLAAARAMGIAFQLGAAEALAYKGFGIDLEAASGKDHHQLPVPSVFLVEPGGTIRWVYSNPDYKVRPDNEAVLEAARQWSRESATPETNDDP